MGGPKEKTIIITCDNIEAHGEGGFQRQIEVSDYTLEHDVAQVRRVHDANGCPEIPIMQHPE